jgi:hypothetical protein
MIRIKVADSDPVYVAKRRDSGVGLEKSNQKN